MERHRRLTQAQIADYEQLCHDRTYGRILTPNGLRFICESCNYDPEAIGYHFLEVLSRICPEHAPSKSLKASKNDTTQGFSNPDMRLLTDEERRKYKRFMGIKQ